MARKRCSGEDILKMLREAELDLVSGSYISSACRAAGIRDATCCNGWILGAGDIAE